MKFEEYKLGDLIESISDTTKIDKTEVILINTSDVENGKVLNHFYTENINLRGQFKKRFKKGDILYSEIRPKNRRFAFVDFESNDYIASTKLMVLRKRVKEVYNDYLFYILSSNSIIDQLQSLAELRSGTFPQITFTELAKLNVKIPSLDVQYKVVKILSDIDRKIELNNQTNENMLNLIDCLFHSSFDSIREFVKVEELANITIGKTPPRNIKECFTTNESDMKWISISDLGKCGTYIFDTSEKLTKESASKYNVKIIPSNTIVLSFKLTVGRIAITTEEMTTNEAIAHFNLYDESMKYYVFSYLKGFDYKKLGSTSSIATAVNSKIIKSMSIGKVNTELLTNYNAKVSIMFEKIKNNENENRTLTKLRETLLPKLLNGEVDLDNMEI